MLSRRLKQFGKIVTDTVRTCDIVCRVGGEEFVIVCPECSVEQAERAVERIRENMEKSEWRNSAGDLMPTVTFSAGITETGEGAGLGFNINIPLSLIIIQSKICFFFSNFSSL